MGGGRRTQVSRATASETPQPSSLLEGKAPWLAGCGAQPCIAPKEGGRASLSSALSGEQGLSLVKLNLQRAKRLPVPRRPLMDLPACFQSAAGVSPGSASPVLRVCLAL